MRKSLWRLTTLVGVVAALAVASTMGASAHSNKTATIHSGGTLNAGWESSFGFTDNFDPTGEYLGDAFGIYDNLLIRTLVGYNHDAGAAGNTIVPDIATVVPTVANGGVSNGGKTYTFHLKSGIKFSPPVNREVTSQDFVTSMDRLASSKDGSEYFFYYSPIKGFDAYRAGKAKTISGISTPNASTVVFNLTAPTGDFLYRMAMPAAGPMPDEVTKCFEGDPGAYSSDLISTAGYMLKGIDSVDISSCDKLVSSTGKPLETAPGFDVQSLIDLVRNPNYDQSTDPTRKNYVDEFHFIVDSSDTDIYNKVESGQMNLAAVSSVPPDVLKKYATDPSLKSHLFINAGDRTWYITMNLTQAPFDDLHVRQAMNWIMDKSALRQDWGGPLTGTVANHIVPDTLFNFKLSEYKPYGTPGDHGSLAKAKAAMKGSKYSTGNDGMCDAAACKNVIMVADTRGVDPGLTATIVQDAKKIGITFKVRQITGAYSTINTVVNNIPISERPGWGKDFADPVTFFSPLFDGRSIIPKGNSNYSLVGITPAQCKALKVTGDCTNVPSVDSLLDKCEALIGGARSSCYAGLDKTLMTKVVPWVPWLSASVVRITASNVTHYQFDQFSTTPAWSQISISS